MNIKLYDIRTTTFFVVAVLFTIILSTPAFSEEIDCTSCHEDLITGTSVHQAVSFGCNTCHGGIDASDIPHKITNRRRLGLSSRQDRLCYDCHERSQFMKSTVHGAIMLLGCTSCHSPHSSANSPLLNEAIPGLCKRCHEEAQLSKAEPHGPIGETSCLTCHDPHATDAPKLLTAGWDGAEQVIVAPLSNRDGS